jgi:hypothetical protein
VLVLVGVDVLIGVTTVEIVVIVLDTSATTEVVPNSLQLLKPVVGLNLLEEIVRLTRLTVTLVPAALLRSLAENTGRGVNIEAVEPIATATHVRNFIFHHGVELDEPVETLAETKADLALQARADLGVDVIPGATDALADEAFERGVVPALGLVIPPVALMHPFVLREIDFVVFEVIQVAAEAVANAVIPVGLGFCVASTTSRTGEEDLSHIAAQSSLLTGTMP